MADVFEVADRIYVMRLGAEAGDFPVGETDRDEIVAAITGSRVANGNNSPSEGAA
jgi:D-xylose transport system ATP-binding protein